MVKGLPLSTYATSIHGLGMGMGFSNFKQLVYYVYVRIITFFFCSYHLLVPSEKTIRHKKAPSIRYVRKWVGTVSEKLVSTMNILKPYFYSSYNLMIFPLPFSRILPKFAKLCTRGVNGVF